jgi:hypothetical protein
MQVESHSSYANTQQRRITAIAIKQDFSKRNAINLQSPTKNIILRNLASKIERVSELQDSLPLAMS